MADLDLPPRLHVQGRTLIKPNGREWVGRGVSFGAWGEDNAQCVPDVAALGVNVVRLPLRWWGKYGGAGVDARDNDAVAFVRRENIANWLDMILAATGAGLWVVPAIDSNCGQSGTQNAEMVRYCDPYSVFGAQGRNFLSDPPMAKLFAVVWQAMARLLRPIAKVAMLELLPEPFDGRPVEVADPLRNLYRQLMDAVREGGDEDTPFLIGARGGYDIALCEEAVLSERNDCVYTGNLLSQYVTNPDKFDAGLQALCDVRDIYGVPVWEQQLGRKTVNDPSLSYMREALNKCNAARVGYAWWQWRQNTHSPDDYALNIKGAAPGVWIAKEDEQAALADAVSAPLED